MLEIKYNKDMNHNYLIVKCQSEPSESRYELKMIIDNKIPGLLRCTTRYVNGETYLYYEVNSLQPLSTLFEGRKINKGQTTNILTGFRKVLQEMQAFLLSDSGLLLSPEYIYMNYETEELFFIYYPYDTGRGEKGLQIFMEFLVTVIDHRDEKLVDMVYGLCQLAERGRFVMEELDYYLESAYYDNSSTSSVMLSSVQLRQSDNYRADRTKEYGTRIENDARSDSIQSRDENNHVIVAPSIEKKRRYIIMASVSLAGAVAILYIRASYVLTDHESLLTWILLFTFLFLFLLTTLVFIILKFSICIESKDEYLKDRGNRATKYFHDCHDIEKGTRLKVDEVDIKSSLSKEYAQSDPELDERYGDTVFLYAAEEKKENKLYGINRGNKHHIDLSNLPCVIGKMSNCTDYCIPDPSISRMHVKFTENDKKVFMTDLNSTNGTYKNGLRLQPSETVAIEPGDEIRLGKLTFCYR